MESMDMLNQGLIKKKWFINSSQKIKKIIGDLNMSGVKAFLMDIDDENNFGEVLSLQKIWKENDIFGVSFRIRSKMNNQIVEISSINWIEGQCPLIRGLILIEKDNKVTHILVEKKFNLVTSNKETRSFGISYPDFAEGKLIKLPQKISKEIPNHNVVNFWDLGYLYADSSLISGKTGIFAVAVEINSLEEIGSSNVELYTKDKINELVESSNDGYLLAIISRLRSKNIL